MSMINQRYNGKKIHIDSFHIYIDGKLPGSSPDEFKFHSFNDAVPYIMDGTKDNPFIIYIAPNVYQINGTAISSGLIINHSWVSLIGLGYDPNDVIIADHRGHMVNSYPSNNGSNSPAQTMIVNGDGLYCENITIGNYLNTDLVYHMDPSKNCRAVSDVITQAYALGGESGHDYWEFHNCNIIGMLDTMSFCQKRVLFEHCLIRGTKDFLGGGDAAVYLNCEIEVLDTCPMYKAGEIITLFKNCVFKVTLTDFDTLYMTKFGNQLILDNCKFIGNLKRIEWELEPDSDLRCYSRNVTLNGDPYLVGKDQENNIPIKKAMEETLSTYNILRDNDGNGSWNPLHEKKVKTTAIIIVIKGENKLNYGEKEDYFISSTPYVPIENLVVSISGPITYSVFSDHITITNHNQTHAAAEAKLALNNNGMYGIKTMVCAPILTEQPKFMISPKIEIICFYANLTYKLEGGNDNSVITWYRLEGNNRIVLKKGQGISCKNYKLRFADIGKHLQVEIYPANPYSENDKKYEIDSDVINEKDVDINNININDFSSFPVNISDLNSKYDFGITSYRSLYSGIEVPHVSDWEPDNAAKAFHYGKGIDGAKDDYGLIITGRGAALTYYRKHIGNMGVKLSICPEKDTGEGFGSANGQFIEIFIKYDAETNTGYGLRIERIPTYAQACQFSLREYTNGINALICPPIMSSAYMCPCYIEVYSLRDKIYAMCGTTFKQPNKAKMDGIQHSVLISGPIRENGFGDFQVHFTGTVPCGNRSILSSMEISYQCELPERITN